MNRAVRQWYFASAEYKGRTYTTYVQSAHRYLARVKLFHAAPSIPSNLWMIVPV